MKLNTRDKLVTWFCNNYKTNVDIMKATNHFPDHRTDHSFHGEGSVWTHTMMVMTHIQCDNTLSDTDKQILLTVALLHDIGKPLSRQVKDDGEKFSFEGHEGLSVFLAIDILNSMEIEDDFYSNSMRIKILELISLHGTYILQTDTHMKMLQTRFRVADKEGAIRNVDENIFAQYPAKKVSSRKRVESEKELVILVGLPGSGKTTYCKNYLSNYFTISRDYEMLKYFERHNIGCSDNVSNNEIYNFVNQEEHIDIFNMEFNEFVDNISKKESKVVIDMTMLTFGKRRKILNRFSKFKAKCFVFLSGETNIKKINDKRWKSNAGLTKERFITLKKKFIMPLKEEGFEEVEIFLRD